jgi:hypothetical protein
VVESAESGDVVANKILHNSVGELASSVKAVVQRLELGGEGNTTILSDYLPGYMYNMYISNVLSYLRYKKKNDFWERKQWSHIILNKCTRPSKLHLSIYETTSWKKFLNTFLLRRWQISISTCYGW